MLSLIGAGPHCCLLLPDDAPEAFLLPKAELPLNQPDWRPSRSLFFVPRRVARFFSNPSGAGEFSATPASTLIFSQRFLAINFNSPMEAILCTNPIDADRIQSGNEADLYRLHLVLSIGPKENMQRME